MLSRLAYRKGIDLLVAAAPRICAKFPHVHFVIGVFGSLILGKLLTPCIEGGEGPKLIDLLQMRERYLLQDRIELLGPIHPRDVRSVRFSAPSAHWWASSELFTGPCPRYHLYEYLPNGGFRHRHIRGGLRGVIRRVHARRWDSRNSP